MKRQYVLYIDYRVNYNTPYKYVVMKAENLQEAIVEADRIHDIDTMYLVRIMEKIGNVEKVESDIRAQTYKAMMEKRSTKWDNVETDHCVKLYMSKYGEWFDIA